MSPHHEPPSGLRQRAALAAEAVVRARPHRRRTRPPVKPRRFGGIWRYLAVVGPGLIVANAGNDAGGVFTYSNIGAKYGTTLLWVLIPVLLALIVTQEMVARLGTVTGKGLMDLIREKFGVQWTLFAAVVVIVANGGTVLAEFAGVAGGLSLLGVNRTMAVLGSALLISIVVLRGNRRLVERVFLALGLAFVSYIVTAIMVHPDWGTIAHDSLIPSLSHPSSVTTAALIADLIALVGTSITPYMQLFLQSSIVDKGTQQRDLNYVRADVISGSIFANLVAAFIIITTGTTIFLTLPGTAHGLAGVGLDATRGATQAAQALGPLAGVHAEQLFAIGLIGASLLAAAVLPLSTAFVVCEAFGAERSVQRTFREAPLFFTLFGGLIAVAACVMLIPSVPVAGVAIGTQLLDGVLLPALLVFIIILANDKRLLGKHRNGIFHNMVAIGLASILIAMTAALMVTTIFPGLAA